jgi:hypothetical protein
VRARENQKLLCLGKFSCFCYFSWKIKAYINGY